MTIEKLDTGKALIVECQEQGCPVTRVYLYTHTITGKKLYAVFLEGQPDDVYESEYVQNPVLVYVNGKWQGSYSYLNG